MAKRPNRDKGTKVPGRARAPKSPMESSTAWPLYARCHGQPVEKPRIQSVDEFDRPVEFTGQGLPRVMSVVVVGGLSFDSKGWTAVRPPKPTGIEDAVEIGSFGPGTSSGSAGMKAKTPFKNGREAEAQKALEVLVQRSPYLEVKRFNSTLDRLPLPDELQARWLQIEAHAQQGVSFAERFDGMGSADRVQFYRGQRYEAYLKFWRSLKGLPAGWLPAEFERLVRLEVGTAAEAVGFKEAVPVEA